MKKVFSIVLALVLVLGMFSSVAFADELPEEQDFECEYMAAPAVAGLILEDAGIDNRFGKGKDGGNYIKEVAQLMDNEAVFPAFEWDGSWDEETYIEKCDEEAYYRAVYNYLAMRTGQLYVGLTTLVITVPVDSYACEPIMAEGGAFPTAQVVDQHGQPVSGVRVRISVIPELVIGDDLQIVTTDEFGFAVFNNAIYNVPNTYRVRYWVYDTDLRNPPYSNPIAGEIVLSQKLDPVASNATFVNNGDSTGTMTITVLDLCGNGIEGLGMDDFVIHDPVLAPHPPQDYQSLTYMDDHGYWSVFLEEQGSGIYEVVFTRDGSIPRTFVWGVEISNECIETITVTFSYDPIVVQAVLESVVFEGAGVSFGTAADETLTLTFSNDVFFSATNQSDSQTYVWFFNGITRLGYSTAHMLYEVSGNIVTITSLKSFSDSRPDIGDLVSGVDGIVDVLGNPVILPPGGVIVEGVSAP